jgi:hypothetical protein
MPGTSRSLPKTWREFRRINKGISERGVEPEPRKRPGIRVNPYADVPGGGEVTLGPRGDITIAENTVAVHLAAPGMPLCFTVENAERLAIRSAWWSADDTIVGTPGRESSPPTRRRLSLVERNRPVDGRSVGSAGSNATECRTCGMELAERGSAS